MGSRLSDAYRPTRSTSEGIEYAEETGPARSSLLKKPVVPRPKHNQGFDGPAPVAEKSMNFKIGTERVGLNLGYNGRGAANWARV